MTQAHFDWKDFANAQFSKALALSLVFVLFIVMVTPQIESKKQKFSSSEMELIDIPMEKREKVEQPQTEVNVAVDIAISDELGTSPVDIEAYEQALTQIGNIYDTSSSTSSQGEDRPVEFIPYDDPPVLIGVIDPVYPEFSRKAGVQGRVILEVEVYSDGVIGEIRVKQSVQAGPGGLDEAAIAAVRKVKFQPGKSSGRPVDTLLIIPVEFTLN
ncbi:MAG TPA: energy transducer TonB [Candidatus Cloacimonadota bacterium]|nr:energy transducer TonB [Candidatus Cloacimonadota bacterium]HPS37867.1 energy transducer TonB [Candidatus Cloacimonadota bacterium]